MIVLPEYGAACLVAHGAFGRYGQVAFHPLVRHGDVLQQQEKKPRRKFASVRRCSSLTRFMGNLMGGRAVIGQGELLAVGVISIITAWWHVASQFPELAALCKSG